MNEWNSNSARRGSGWEEGAAAAAAEKKSLMMLWDGAQPIYKLEANQTLESIELKTDRKKKKWMGR